MPLSAVDNDTREIDYDDHSDSEEYNDGRDFLASLTDLANNCVMTNDSRRSSETSHYDSVRGDDSVTTADSDHQNDPQEIYDFLSQIHELHPFSIHQQFGFIASPPFHCTSFSPNNDLSPSSSMHVNLEASPQHSTISMHSHMTRSQSPAFYTRHAGSCFNENGPLPLLDGSKSRRLGSIGSPLANSASLSDIVMQDH
ncbi:MAG: hypothetical protein M1834_004939 [Cirrosporium novae-zelandiae]|nr:MAG: hypothetical protein M1834_004939 [Cirrosporium novae-zelandiae]